MPGRGTELIASSQTHEHVEAIRLGSERRMRRKFGEKDVAFTKAGEL
jgi:hypothetical protein